MELQHLELQPPLVDVLLLDRHLGGVHHVGGHLQELALELDEPPAVDVREVVVQGVVHVEDHPLEDEPHGLRLPAELVVGVDVVGYRPDLLFELEDVMGGDELHQELLLAVSVDVHDEEADEAGVVVEVVGVDERPFGLEVRHQQDDEHHQQQRPREWVVEWDYHAGAALAPATHEQSEYGAADGDEGIQSREIHHITIRRVCFPIVSRSFRFAEDVCDSGVPVFNEGWLLEQWDGKRL